MRGRLEFVLGIVGWCSMLLVVELDPRTCRVPLLRHSEFVVYRRLSRSGVDVGSLFLGGLFCCV